MLISSSKVLGLSLVQTGDRLVTCSWEGAGISRGSVWPVEVGVAVGGVVVQGISLSIRLSRPLAVVGPVSCIASCWYAGSANANLPLVLELSSPPFSSCNRSRDKSGDVSRSKRNSSRCLPLLVVSKLTLVDELSSPPLSSSS